MFYQIRICPKHRQIYVLVYRVNRLRITLCVCPIPRYGPAVAVTSSWRLSSLKTQLTFDVSTCESGNNTSTPPGEYLSHHPTLRPKTTHENKYIVCHNLVERPKQGSPLPSMKGYPGSPSDLSSPCYHVCISAGLRWTGLARHSLPASVEPLHHGEPSGRDASRGPAPDEAVHLVCPECRSELPRSHRGWGWGVLSMRMYVSTPHIWLRHCLSRSCNGLPSCVFFDIRACETARNIIGDKKARKET
jgi:hypothetical protein